MIQRRRGLIVTGFLAALVALVVLFPARVAYKLASPPHVSMAGFSGTVWNGGAREFSTNGIYFRDIKWRMRPLSLITGKAVFEVSGAAASGILDSVIAVSLGGEVSLRDLTASLPLAVFEKSAGVPGLRGDASLQFERLDLVKGRATALVGSLDVANLVVPMLGRGSLGGYRAEFFTQSNGIVASVEDTDGVVDLAGSLQINPDKTYVFRGQVVPKASTPESLRQQIKYLPQTDRPGQHELSLEGSY